MIRATLTALAMAVALAWLGPALDGIDDHSHEIQQAKNIEDAQRAEAARQRFNKAARHLCGPQSPWREISRGVIQCLTRSGKPTTQVSIKE
jgi:hypothetical protein